MLRRVGRAQRFLVWAQLLGLFGACHCAKAGFPGEPHGTHPALLACQLSMESLRWTDSNRRPEGYEPPALPLRHTAGVIKPQSLVVSQSAQLGQNASVLFATSYARSDPYRALPKTTRSWGRFPLESYPIANKTLAARVYIRLGIGSQTSYRALAARNPAPRRTEVHP
jgi:hypothetical protein